MIRSRIVLAAALAVGLAIPAFAQSADEKAIRDLEEQFLNAKLKQDIKTLDRLYHQDFYSTNQTGNSRNRQEALDLWATFSVASLKNEISRLRVSGDTAIVSGTTYEKSGTGTDPFLFTRTYVRTREGWKMLSNMQSWPGNGMGAERLSADIAATSGPRGRTATTPSGLSVEEVRVGESCVVVVSRTAGPVSVVPCSQPR